MVTFYFLLKFNPIPLTGISDLLVLLINVIIDIMPEFTLLF
uniref:Uncharacterized protein n=1 Tax=Siphoviridae sp. ctREU2 TaxID=2826333 RepID=A0A8S5NJR0_9CAUD|nr:MAG TPA: hypothetical protein [Siphoviridae sp. ctREU2]